MLERTLILLKPDAVDRGIIGEIITRFERVGAKIIGMKMLVSEKDTAEQHYTEDLARRRGENVRHLMIAMLTSGPIVVLALEGIDIITIVRKMIGATQPFEAAPGTIRGDYAHISYRYADEKRLVCLILFTHPVLLKMRMQKLRFGSNQKSSYRTNQAIRV